MIKDIVKKESEMYVYYETGNWHSNTVWARLRADETPKRISIKIWKILRELDVQPAKLPKLHQELFEVYVAGYEDFFKHRCRCDSEDLLNFGCQCDGK